MMIPSTSPAAAPATGLVEVAFFNAVNDTIPKPVRLTWDAFVRRIGRPRFADCGTSCIGHGCPSRLGPGWSGARFRAGGRRRNEDVVGLQVLVFDVDCVERPVLVACMRRLEAASVASAIIPTHSDRSARRSVRLVVRPSREVQPREWGPLRAVLVNRFAIPADPDAADCARLWFARSIPAGLPVAPVLAQDGPPLDVDEALRGVQIPDSEPAAPAVKPPRRSGGEWATLLANLGEGRRDVGMTEIAGVLFRELPAELAYHLLHTVNEARCKPSLSSDQVDKIASSIARREAARRSRP